MKKTFLIIVLLFSLHPNVEAFTLDLHGWEQISDKHFKVFYKQEAGEDSPRQILNRAEEYYSSIADRVGYERYQNFWTWDERVPIVYFSSQEEYARTTGQPIWSKGFSVSHLASVNLRMIVTFKGQDNFLTSTLPHEISHLILHDFIGPNRKIPLWFDEGVAQLEEQREDQNYEAILARVVASGQSMPLSFLQHVDQGTHLDYRYSSIFYAESLYIVDFLVKTYGKESFVNFCRYLRDGKSFEEALRSSYYPTIDSMDKLQDSWVKYMTQYL
ncbi:MAG: hypothetical protein HQL15_07295 [Candidatus Omnitrophica bacterium]|nr:hypothetical protein [Candidatus Omnitrophota bacterium]